MVSNDDRARLEQARELIMQKQFAEARAILRGMTHTDTARKWLTKLDEIAPETVPPPVQPVTGIPDWVQNAAAPGTTRKTRQTVNVALDLDVDVVRYAVAGIVAVMAVLMIVGFAAFPWMDMTDVSFMGFSLDAFGGEIDKGPLEITALEIWTGRNSGENFTLDLTVEDGQGSGIADVRALDRFLVLIPFLGILLLWLAWMYAFPARDGLSPLVSVALIAFVALILLLFPFAWEDMSTSAMENDLKDSMMFEMDGGEDFDLDLGGFFDASMFTGIFTEAYSTGEQQLLGALALLTALVGLAIEVMNGRATPAPAAGLAGGGPSSG